MAYTKGTSVDKKKLLYELSKRDLSLEGVSKEVGLNPAYLSNAIHKANKNVTQEVRISPLCVRLLYELYNIRPESILFEFETTKKQETQSSFTSDTKITPEALYTIIYRAVYEAMTLALKGE